MPRWLHAVVRWMWPPLLLLHPPIASSLLEYRVQRIEQAKQKALSYSPPYAGAMFPWESASTGVETCPSWASTGALGANASMHIIPTLIIAPPSSYPPSS